MQLVASLLALAVSGTLAAPLEVSPEILQERAGTPCIAHYTYTVKNEKVSHANPHLVTGFRCTSLKTDDCELTHSATYTKTVTKTASAGLSGALELSKIFTLGADAGFSYSWSTSDSTGTSATVNCPKGEFECGLMAIATVVTTTGTVHKIWEGENCLGQQNSHGHYKVVAPKTIPHVPQNQAAIVDFKACYVKCHGDKCKEAKKIGLPKCPKK